MGVFYRNEISRFGEGQRMTAAVKLAGGNSPEGRLAALKAERAGLQARIAGLAGARRRLGEAEEAERAATAALGALSAAEVAAASAWAAQGAVGAAPVPDAAKRQELAGRLATAEAASRAARGACASLDTEMALIRAEVAAVEASIEAAALDVLELERQATLAELIKVAARAGHLIARLRAHSFSLGERGRHLRDNNDPSGAHRYFVEAERLAGQQLPDLTPSAGDIDMARKEWLARFEGLRA
jgi:hypothetical protein